MKISLTNTNMPAGSPTPEESKPAILSNEEKEFLDLFADIIVQDILKKQPDED